MTSTVTDLSPADLGGEPPSGPKLGLLGWLRWGWRQLTSMRVALYLLGLLALASVPGSLLPQRRSDPAGVLGYFRENPTWAPRLDRLSLFDVYSSSWFQAVYLLLFISLVGCVIPRALKHLKAYGARPTPPPSRMSRQPGYETWRTDAAPDAVLAVGEAHLTKSRYRIDRIGSANSGSIAAEKGYLHEIGNLAFHLALLTLLIAIAVGHRGNYRGSVAVPEGDGFSNSPVQFDTFTSGPGVSPESMTPLSLTLDKLDVTYQESGSALGTPREFIAHVTYRETPDSAPKEADVSPNKPLVVNGTKVFLLGQGYAPRFTVRDGKGTIVSSGPTVLLPTPGDKNLSSVGVVKAPDAQPTQLGFDVTFLPTALRVPGADGGTVPISIFPDTRAPRVFVTGAWQGDLGLDGGRPQSVYRLNTTAMTQVKVGDVAATAELKPGEVITLPDNLGSLTFDGTSRFASFSVAADPGRIPALGAGLMALLGLMTSLYLRPRRMWVRATRGADGYTEVEVGAGARRESERLSAEAAALAARVREVGHTVGSDERTEVS